MQKPFSFIVSDANLNSIFNDTIVGGDNLIFNDGSLAVVEDPIQLDNIFRLTMMAEDYKMEH